MNCREWHLLLSVSTYFIANWDSWAKVSSSNAFACICEMSQKLEDYNKQTYPTNPKETHHQKKKQNVGI